MDERFKPAIPQIVFYQSGMGSQKNLYSEYVEGMGKFLNIGVHFNDMAIVASGTTGGTLGA